MYINFWYAAEQSENVTDKPVGVRMLGQDFVLFRDTAGTVHCLSNVCTHRGASLAGGTIEGDCVGCPYHGWLFDQTGACVDQPSEPAGSRFKEKVRLQAYPVQEVPGLVFVYMGPQPVPLLPMWDLLAWENATRNIFATMLPCNWLQCHETASIRSSCILPANSLLPALRKFLPNPSDPRKFTLSTPYPRLASHWCCGSYPQ